MDGNLGKLVRVPDHDVQQLADYYNRFEVREVHTLLPIEAVRATLAGINEKNMNWTETEIQDFRTQVEGKVFPAKITKVESN